MDAVTQFAPRSTESVVHGESPVRRVQTLAATATYRLSEQGRKASLLAGGDGRALQEITLAVPTNRIHLVNVDAEGKARLKLQPRYLLNADQQVVRNEDPPIFDAMPSVDDLLKEAARNHQLENAYNVERAESKRKQQDRWFELHQHMAEEFLADPKRRARVHPRPTPRQCHLLVHNSIIRFDIKTDVGIARQVPPEAYRRFCADERERVERGQTEFKKGYAVHEEKDRLIAEWVATHGTRHQQERHAARLLPLEEVLDGMADHEFDVAKDRPRYVADGVERLQTFLRQFPQYSHVVLSKADLEVKTSRAEDATEAQWAMLREFRALFPKADVTLQRHSLAWSGDHQAPRLTIYGVLVRRKLGPFNVRREFLAPSADSVDERFVTEGAAMAVFDKTP
jgi:hypothetical protein